MTWFLIKSVYGQRHDDILKKALQFLNGEAVLRKIMPTEKSFLTTDVSLLGLGTVFDQSRKPPIFISSRLRV